MALGDAADLGYSSFLGVAPEATWGTHVTATNFLEYSSEGFTKTRESKKIEALGSTGRNPRQRYLGNNVVEGNVECNLNITEDACAQIINHAMGGTVTTSRLTAGASTDTSSYEHVPAQGTYDASATGLSFTARKGSNRLYQFNGCRVNSLTLKCDGPDQPVVLSAEFIGQDSTVCSDSLTVSLSDNKPLLGKDVTFYTADTEGALDASGVAETILGFEFNYNNNLLSDDDSRALGSVNLAVLPMGQATASLKIKTRYDATDATWHDRAFNETPFACELQITSQITLGADDGDTVASMLIRLPVVYAATENQIPEIGDTGIIVTDIELEPMQPTSGSEVVIMKYYNQTTGY